MVEPLPDVPKFLIKDLKCCRKLEDDTWEYDISVHVETQEVKKTVNFNLVYIQGFIDQKPCDDVMILRDCTGKVKLTNCIIANKGSGKEVLSGDYCSVIGIFVRETGLPEISAAKITVLQSTDIDKHLYYKYWPCEVRDYQLFFLDIVKPLIFPENKVN